MDNTIVYGDPPKKSGIMLACKIFLILGVIDLYAMQIPMAVVFYSIYAQKPKNFNFKLIGIEVGIFAVCALVSFILGIIAGVKNTKPMTNITFILKLVMIPFFIINLVMWLCLVAGLMNPFTFLGIPFAIAIGACLTYFYMIATGLPDVMFAIIYHIKNKKKPKAIMVAGILLCFIFVLDVVGIFLMNKAYKDYELTE
ncbi:MAG: hypothetical protein K6G47_01320 [Clostridia bacterium]|nr:hypothetical protein [Clostridia bacterium]